MPAGAQPAPAPTPAAADLPTRGFTDAAEPAPAHDDPAQRDPAQEPEAVPGGRVAARVIIGLAVLVLVLGLTVGWLVSLVRAPRSAGAATQVAVLQAAGQVVDVLSLDYHHLPADFARAESRLTPHFLAQHATELAQIRQAAADNHLVLSASVSAEGIAHLGPNQATVLLFVDEISTNAARATPRIDENRVRVILLRTHGRWLIDEIDAL